MMKSSFAWWTFLGNEALDGHLGVTQLLLTMRNMRLTSFIMVVSKVVIIDEDDAIKQKSLLV